MKQIVFATNNKNKLRELREIMDGLYEVLSLDDIGCHEEIVEDADTIEGNAKIKADFVTNKSSPTTRASRWRLWAARRASTRHAMPASIAATRTT